MGNLNVAGTTTIIDTVINNTSFNSFSVSGPTIHYSNATCMSSLNIAGNIIGNGTALSNLNYNAITNKPDLTGYATNTNLNSLSTNSILSINNLNATSTSLLNKTNFSNLLVSGASTCLSSLNIVGGIIGSGSALTNLNYNAILNPPTMISFNNP